MYQHKNKIFENRQLKKMFTVLLLLILFATSLSIKTRSQNSTKLLLLYGPSWDPEGRISVVSLNDDYTLNAVESYYELETAALCIAYDSVNSYIYAFTGDYSIGKFHLITSNYQITLIDEYSATESTGFTAFTLDDDATYIYACEWGGADGTVVRKIRTADMVEVANVTIAAMNAEGESLIVVQQYLYVLTRTFEGTPDNRVYKINTASMTVVDYVSLGGEVFKFFGGANPYNMAYYDGYLYIAGSSDTGGYARIYRIDLTSFEVSGYLTLRENYSPDLCDNQIAIRDGQAYVGVECLGEGGYESGWVEVYVIDLATFTSAQLYCNITYANEPHSCIAVSGGSSPVIYASFNDRIVDSDGNYVETVGVYNHLPLYIESFVEEGNEEYSVLPSKSISFSISVNIFKLSSGRSSVGVGTPLGLFFENNYYWAFYQNATGIYYKTSADGSSWSSATVAIDNSLISQAIIRTNGTHFHIVYLYSVYLMYRCGKISENTITWGSVYTVRNFGSSGNIYWLYDVKVDNTGYVWILFRKLLSYNPPYTVRWNITRNARLDGSWLDATGYPVSFTCPSDGGYSIGAIQPFNSTAFYVVYNNATYIYGCHYVGSTRIFTEYFGGRWVATYDNPSAIDMIKTSDGGIFLAYGDSQSHVFRCMYRTPNGTVLITKSFGAYSEYDTYDVFISQNGSTIYVCYDYCSYGASSNLKVYCYAFSLATYTGVSSPSLAIDTTVSGEYWATWVQPVSPNKLANNKIIILATTDVQMWFISGDPPPVSFQSPTYVQVSLTSTAGGSVSPTGFHYYLQNSYIRLTASAAPSSRFSHWVIGVSNQTANPLLLSVSSDTEVKAVFIRQFNLSFSIVNPTRGTVNLTQGIHTYDEGTVLRVVAKANLGWAIYWLYDGVKINASYIIVQMNQNHELTCVFDYLVNLTWRLPEYRPDNRRFSYSALDGLIVQWGHASSMNITIYYPDGSIVCYSDLSNLLAARNLKPYYFSPRIGEYWYYYDRMFIYEGVFYFVAENPTLNEDVLVAYNATLGQIIWTWKFNSSSDIDYLQIAEDGTILVYDIDECNLTALNHVSGEMLWSRYYYWDWFITKGNYVYILADPVGSGDFIYGARGIAAVSVSTGEVIWNTTLPSNYVFDFDSLYANPFAVDDDYTLYALCWWVDWDALPVDPEEYPATNFLPSLIALDSEGSFLWGLNITNYGFPFDIPPLVAKDYVYVHIWGDRVVAVRKTGTFAWSYRMTLGPWIIIGGFGTTPVAGSMTLSPDNNVLCVVSDFYTDERNETYYDWTHLHFINAKTGARIAIVDILYLLQDDIYLFPAGNMMAINDYLYVVAELDWFLGGNFSVWNYGYYLLTFDYSGNIIDIAFLTGSDGYEAMSMAYVKIIDAPPPIEEEEPPPPPPPYHPPSEGENILDISAVRMFLIERYRAGKTEILTVKPSPDLIVIFIIAFFTTLIVTMFTKRVKPSIAVAVVMVAVYLLLFLPSILFPVKEWGAVNTGQGLGILYVVANPNDTAISYPVIYLPGTNTEEVLLKELGGYSNLDFQVLYQSGLISVALPLTLPPDGTCEVMTIRPLEGYRTTLTVVLIPRLVDVNVAMIEDKLYRIETYRVSNYFNQRLTNVLIPVNATNVAKAVDDTGKPLTVFYDQNAQKSIIILPSIDIAAERTIVVHRLEEFTPNPLATILRIPILEIGFSIAQLIGMLIGLLVAVGIIVKADRWWGFPLGIAALFLVYVVICVILEVDPFVVF